MGKVSTHTHFPLEQGCEDYSLLDQMVKDFKHSLNSILSVFPLKTQNWMHPLMRLILDLLQSLQDFYAWLVPIQLFLNCSFLQASNLINYGAWVGHYFCPSHRQAKCQPLKLISYFFPVIQQHLDSRLLCYLTTSFWMQPIRLIRVFLIFRLALVYLFMSPWIQSNLLLILELPFQI